jgi:LysM repeat protein
MLALEPLRVRPNVKSIAIGNAIGNSIAAEFTPRPVQRAPEDYRWDMEMPANTGSAANSNPVQVTGVMPTQREIYGVDGTGETLESLPADPQGQARSYRTAMVRSGDTLTKLARTSDPATLDKIAEFNGLRSRHEIRAGETLTIPDAAALAGIVPGQALAERGAAMAQVYAQRLTDAAQAATASNVDPTDGLRAGPTLERLALRSGASAAVTAAGSTYAEARAIAQGDDVLRAPLFSSLRESSFGQSNAGQVATGALHRWLYLTDDFVGAVKGLASLPGRAYDAIEQKGFGQAALDGYGGFIGGVRQGFFNVAYGTNGEARGALGFDVLTAGAGSIYLRGSGTLLESGTSLAANEVRFSQRSVSYLKDRPGQPPYTYDDIVASMRSDGWRADRGNIDVVQMPDGRFTSVDNTRLLAAREAGIDVSANIRSFDERLNAEALERFARPNRGFFPETWGDVIGARIANQSRNWSMQNPYGSLNPPKVTGRP